MEHLFTFLKGAAMGAANVIPGVSGGTIAFITGIYERLLNAVKSFGLGALKLLLQRKFGEFIKVTDFWFLTAIGLGAVVSILSFAKFLEWGFENYPTYVWAFFFGLILASVPFVAKMVRKWGIAQIVALAIGTATAVSLAFMTPAAENDNFVYLMLCGVAAMCSMIIPGVSGSFVLLLMGNYPLVLRAINERDLGKIIPIGIGAVVGVVALSHFLSWLFKRFHDTAVALITGFVLGSLPTIWPWKVPIIEEFDAGDEVKEKAVGYDFQMPNFGSTETWIAIGLAILGAAILVGVEVAGRSGSKPEK